jgi:hypothetical protein
MADQYDEETKARVIELVERVKLLFTFCAQIFPDKDLLEKTVEVANERSAHIDAGAVLVEASGIDYFAASDEARIKKERAKALYDFIVTLERTDKELTEVKKKAGERRIGAEQIKRMFGL